LYVKNIGSERWHIINVQVQTLSLSRQCILTRDGIQISIDAICFYRLVDVERAIFAVSDYQEAIKNLACYTLEVVMAEITLQDFLRQREETSTRIANSIKSQTEAWGVEIEAIEIRDLDLPTSLVRVLASGAEAEREGKAKLIAAQSELAAAESYARAARILSETPGAMELRYLQTLREIAAEQNSTIILPSNIGGLVGSLGG
jgi:regulator of protease activity HflC (stomatin/prohibitin superfamily)